MDIRTHMCVGMYLGALVGCGPRVLVGCGLYVLVRCGMREADDDGQQGHKRLA